MSSKLFLFKLNRVYKRGMHQCGNQALLCALVPPHGVNDSAWHSSSPVIRSQCNSPSTALTTLPIFFNPPSWCLSFPRTGPGIPPFSFSLLFIPPEMPYFYLHRTSFYSAWYAHSYILGQGKGVPVVSIAAHIFHTTFTRIASIQWALTICQEGTLLKIYILSSH